jgi:aromatic ring-cleaving dioxygenase
MIIINQPRCSLTKTILRAGLNLMFHINTGCMADDHTIRAFWAGERR